MVDPRAQEIIRAVTEFEASVEAAEPALAACNWKSLDALLAAQHRLTYALASLLEETRDTRPAAFTAEFERRIAAIVARRGDQLRRLIAFNHLVKQRLIMIARSRAMLRGATRSPARILDVKQ